MKKLLVIVSIFLTLTTIILFWASCTKEIVETPNTTQVQKNCSIRTLPNQRLPEVTEGMLQADPGGWTPNVTFYDEFDYETYTYFGMDSAKTWAYIKQVQKLQERQFAINQIRISHYQTKLWTTPDPYSGSVDAQLDQFGDRMGALTSAGQKPKADFYFLNAMGTYGGGVAYVGTLCFQTPFAKTGCTQIWGGNLFQSAIEFIAHEKGHLLGSNHTFSCAWLVDGITSRKLDCSYGCGTTCGGYPNPINPVEGYYHIMSYAYPDSTKGFSGQAGSVVRNNIFNNSGCLIYPNGIPTDTVVTPPPTDTCTTYLVKVTNKGCPVNSIGYNIDSTFNTCPNHVQITKSYNTCKDTSTTTIQYCAPCANKKIITCRIDLNGSYFKVIATGYTNYYYDWYDVTTNQEMSKFKLTNGTIIPLSSALDSCGNLKTNIGQRYNDGWIGQQVSFSKLIKGHIYKCIVRSTNTQTTTNCYIPSFCTRTY